MKPGGRTRWALAAGIVALLALASALAWRFFGGPHPAPDPYAGALFVKEPVTLAPGVHMLGRSFPSVVYAIETSEGLILVDSGLESDAALVREQLAALKLDAARVRKVVLTHAHGDHTLGARYFRETTNAKIYAGQGDCDVLRAGGPREAFFSNMPMDRYALHATPVDVELAGGEMVQLGDTRLEAIATPGHTPGSTCYLLQRGDLRILFTGDTVSSLELDLGTYAAHLAPRYRSRASDYVESLHRLQAMPAPDLVLPGHPTASDTPHGPRITPEQWNEVLGRGLADLENAIGRYARDGEDFLDGNPKEILPGLFYLGDYASRAVYVLVTPQGGFLFEAPGDEGFPAFVREGLKTAGVDKFELTAVVLTSCDPVAIQSLGAVVKETGCKVVAPVAGRDAVAAACPTGTQILSPDDLVAAHWFAVQVVPLAGRGVGSTAYLLPWENKRVLISGSIPTRLNEQVVSQLAAEMQSPPGNVSDYLKSLEDLRSIHPDVWLPATPVQAPNANLYGDEWSKVLDQNRALLLGR